MSAVPAGAETGEAAALLMAREYGRTDPAAVRAFVADHHGELSGLSRREALKHLS